MQQGTRTGEGGIHTYRQCWGGGKSVPSMARRRQSTCHDRRRWEPRRSFSRRAWRPAAAGPLAWAAAAAPPTPPGLPHASARPARCAAACALPAQPPAARAGAGGAAGTGSLACRLQRRRQGGARRKPGQQMGTTQQPPEPGTGRQRHTTGKLGIICSKLGVRWAAERLTHHRLRDPPRPTLCMRLPGTPAPATLRTAMPACGMPNK